MVRTVLGSGILLVACSAGSGLPTDTPPGSEHGEALPASVASVSTTLDFGRAPLRGDLVVSPRERTDLQYEIDLDLDGVAEESGSVGLGVVVGYSFSVPGPHRMGVTLSSPEEVFRVERTIVVDDPTVLELVARRPIEVSGPLSGIAFDPDERRVWVSAPNQDALIELDADQLTETRRATFPMIDYSAVGIETSESGEALFADVGDSLVRLDLSVIGFGAVEPFARADRGDLVERLADGDLVAGGSRGVLRIDPVTGETQAERALLGGFGSDLEPSPDGLYVAWSGTTELHLLSAEDLSDLWTLPLPYHTFVALAFDASGTRLFAFTRVEGEWVLYVLETRTGEIERRLTIANTGRGSRAPFVTRPAARTKDDRSIIFASEIGALVVDATTALPVAGELDAEVDGGRFGCCNVIPAGASVAFLPGSPFSDRTDLLDVRIRR